MDAQPTEPPQAPLYMLILNVCGVLATDNQLSVGQHPSADRNLSSSGPDHTRQQAYSHVCCWLFYFCDGRVCPGRCYVFGGRKYTLPFLYNSHAGIVLEDGLIDEESKRQQRD